MCFAAGRPECLIQCTTPDVAEGVSQNIADALYYLSKI